MSLPRYSEYKGSGVPWLGEVPSHWEIKRLKHLGEAIIGLTYDPSEVVNETEGTLVLRSSNVQQSKIAFEDNVFVAKEIPQKFLTTIDDILICSRNGSRALIGKNALITKEAAGMTFGAFMTIFRSPINKYLYWVFNSQIFSFQSSTFLTSTINQLTTGNLYSFAIPLPSNQEQTAIATFLDRETGKIDALIAEQEKLLALLAEKRQATISHAVAKGLNPDAPMKDSGEEWLGEVPEHWTIGPLKYFVQNSPGAIKTGPFGSQLTSAEMEVGSIKVYNQRNVIDGDFSQGENYISEEKFEQLSGFEAFHGDVLVTTRGTIGRAAILPENAEKGILHPCLLRVQVNKELLSASFLQTLIQESDLLKIQIALNSNATTIEVIYSYTMATLLIPLPPIAEQLDILVFIESQTAKLDILKSEAERTIELLKERRTALISAAVTGKIDVRNTVTEEVAT